MNATLPSQPPKPPHELLFLSLVSPYEHLFGLLPPQLLNHWEQSLLEHGCWSTAAGAQPVGAQLRRHGLFIPRRCGLAGIAFFGYLGLGLLGYTALALTGPSVDRAEGAARARSREPSQARRTLVGMPLIPHIQPELPTDSQPLPSLPAAGAKPCLGASTIGGMATDEDANTSNGALSNGAMDPEERAAIDAQRARLRELRKQLKAEGFDGTELLPELEARAATWPT
jgi:hypothetical protein